MPSCIRTCVRVVENPRSLLEPSDHRVRRWLSRPDMCSQTDQYSERGGGVGIPAIRKYHPLVLCHRWSMPFGGEGLRAEETP